MAVTVTHNKHLQQIHITYAGALALNDIKFAQKRVKKALKYPVDVIITELSDVMATEDTVQKLLAKPLLLPMSGNNGVRYIVYVVPGLMENPIAQAVIAIHHDDQTSHNISCFETLEQAQKAVAMCRQTEYACAQCV